MGVAAAFVFLALEQNRSAGILDDVLVVAKHFKWGTVLRQHIGEPGERAFDFNLELRLENVIVHCVPGVGVFRGLERRCRHCEVGVVEALKGNDEGALIALEEGIIGGAFDVSGRYGGVRQGACAEPDQGYSGPPSDLERASVHHLASCAV